MTDELSNERLAEIAEGWDVDLITERETEAMARELQRRRAAVGKSVEEAIDALEIATSNHAAEGATIEDQQILIAAHATLRTAIAAEREAAVTQIIDVARFQDELGAASWCREWFDQKCREATPVSKASVEQSGKAFSLYIGTRLVATTFVTRDPMNFSVGFRILVPDTAIIRRTP